MPCTPFEKDGMRGFLCTPTKRCKCGRAATRECDWKTPAKKSGTCDAAMCERCSHVPAPGKDLCAAHWADFKVWKRDRAKA